MYALYIEILSELMKWLFVKYSWKPTAVMRIVAVFGGFYTFHWKGFRSQPKTPKEFRPCLAMNFKADLGILLLELHVSVVRWKINWEKGDSVKTTRLGLFCTLFSSQLKLSASLSISDNRSIFFNYLGFEDNGNWARATPDRRLPWKWFLGDRKSVGHAYYGILRKPLLCLCI